VTLDTTTSRSRAAAAWRDSTLRGVSGPPGTPGGNRGAPPRGVDVKPLAGGGSQGPGRAFRTRSGDRGPGSRRPGSRRPPGSGSRGAPSPGGGPGEPSGPRPGSRTPPRGWFYINPSRRGPAVPGGGPGDPGSRRGPGRPPREAFFQPWPRRASDPLFRPPREPRGPGARG